MVFKTENRFIVLVVTKNNPRGFIKDSSKSKPEANDKANILNLNCAKGEMILVREVR